MTSRTGLPPEAKIWQENAGRPRRGAILMSGTGANAEALLADVKARGEASPWRCAVMATDAPETSRTREIAAAAGHTFGEWTVSVPASVEAEGEETRVCAVCGAAETRPIPRIETLAVTAENIGDVDGDGEVTAADARLALRAAVELEHFDEKTADIADADRDGAITAADARLILRAAVELEDRRTWLKKE